MEDYTDEPGPPPVSEPPASEPPAQAAEPAAEPAGEAAPADVGAEEAGELIAAASEETAQISREGEGRQTRLMTGEPRVDAALARLDELPDLPVTEHRAVFEHVHRSLTEVLGELDAGLPPGGGDDHDFPGGHAGNGPGRRG